MRTDARKEQSSRHKLLVCGGCGGCGGPHVRKICKFLDAECHNCGKKGHIAKVCKSKKLTTHQTKMTEQPREQIDTVQPLNRLIQVNAFKTCERQILTILIDGHSLKMELDSGAPCGIISKKTLRTFKPQFTLLETDRQFVSYTQYRLNCIGRIPVNVTLGNTTRNLDLYVVEGNYDTLFGREWITQFVQEIDFIKLFPNPEQIHNITVTSPQLTVKQRQHLDAILQRHQDMFSNTPGKLVGPPVSIHFKPGTTQFLPEHMRFP